MQALSGKNLGIKTHDLRHLYRGYVQPGAMYGAGLWYGLVLLPPATKKPREQQCGGSPDSPGCPQRLPQHPDHGGGRDPPTHHSGRKRSDQALDEDEPTTGRTLPAPPVSPANNTKASGDEQEENGPSEATGELRQTRLWNEYPQA